ncbi:GntR family transcriptional regulator [Alkalicoccobacillus murimartini]|uniref:DNA-binding GntR family transcriptional regulator n=1 Tax=Alkalicoccobacillus murimartini TaxID=171685 RepID=A0ABT9YEI5_9BACI|nr:GntR family transcriptional regulator [Alkalicoccobacillus murimartini]MDQ0206141.1 DNA-binding GntR family transcriptional regulator [Alkalicoccobacillus murimartini]
MSRKKQVYEHLLELILSNKLTSGSPLIEMDISKELQTSRTPVREALKELESDGLVYHYPSKGAFVTNISASDVEEIFSLRIMLEVFALQQAIEKIDPQELDRLEDMFTSLDEDSSKEDLHEADTSLHQLIMDRAGNRRLKQFLMMLSVQIERFRRVAAFDTNRLSFSKKEHLEIISFIKKKDVTSAEESLIKHLENVKKSTLEASKRINI